MSIKKFLDSCRKFPAAAFGTSVSSKVTANHFSHSLQSHLVIPNPLWIQPSLSSQHSVQRIKMVAEQNSEGVKRNIVFFDIEVEGENQSSTENKL